MLTGKPLHSHSSTARHCPLRIYFHKSSFFSYTAYINSYGNMFSVITNGNSLQTASPSILACRGLQLNCHKFLWIIQVGETFFLFDWKHILFLASGSGIDFVFKWLFLEKKNSHKKIKNHRQRVKEQQQQAQAIKTAVEHDKKNFS